MIPGVTTIGIDTFSRLPAELAHSTPNPFEALLRAGLKDVIYALVAHPIDPSTGMEQLVTLASGSLGTGSATTTLWDGTVVPAHRLFRSRLLNPYNISIQAMGEGRISPGTSSSGGALSINLAYGDLDKYRKWIWEGTRRIILAGRRNTPLSEFTPISVGTFGAQTLDHQRLTLPLKDPAEFFRQKRLQENLYRGYGTCARLKGVSGYVSSQSSAIATTASLTCELRFRASKTSPPGAAQILAAHGSAANSSGWDWYVELTTAGYLHLVVPRSSGSTSCQITKSVDYRDDAWHRLALSIVAGTGGVILYVDGIPAGTATAPTYASNTGKLWIGAQIGGASGFAKACINDVRLWSVVRTPQQILANMDGFLNGAGTGLRLEWELRDGTGTTPQDASTANLDADLVGGASWIGSGEGGEELRGKPKPLWYGWREQRGVVWVDGLNTSNVFQIHDGWMKGMTRAYDKGNGTSLVYDGDVASWDALYDATVAAGHWISCHVLGFGRTGAKPDGQLTVDGEGDMTGGVYVASRAGIFRRVAERAGKTVGDFDLESLAVVEAISPSEMGYSTSTETVFVEAALNDIASPIATWFFDRLEHLVLWLPTDPGVPTISVLDRNVKLNRVKKMEVLPPPSQVKVFYRPYEVVQNTDVSTSLSQAQKEDLGQAYRTVERDGVVVLGRDVKDRYRLAVPMELFTAFRYEADAVTEGDRTLKLFQDVEMWEIPLIEGLFQYKIGDSLSFWLSRLLTDGVVLVVAGYVENVDGNDIRLICWAPVPVVVAEPLLEEDGDPLLVELGDPLLAA